MCVHGATRQETLVPSNNRITMFKGSVVFDAAEMMNEQQELDDRDYRDDRWSQWLWEVLMHEREHLGTSSQRNVSRHYDR